MAQATVEVSQAPETAPSMLKGAFFAVVALVLLTCLLGGLYARQDERDRANASATPTSSRLPQG